MNKLLVFFVGGFLVLAILGAIFGTSPRKLDYCNPFLNSSCKNSTNSGFTVPSVDNDCREAYIRYQRVTDRLGTWQWRNCAAQKGRIWCWDKKGKEKCEIKI